MTAYSDATQCFYCELSFGKSVLKTRDHVIPKSKGGDGSVKNIVPACQFCNTLKASHDLDYFFNLVLIRKHRKSANNQGRDLDIVLTNIAILKGRINRGEDLTLHREFSNNTKTGIKKTIQEGKQLKLLLNRDWGFDLYFRSELSRDCFINTLSVVEKSKGKRLTPIDGYDLYRKIIAEPATPNFHEEFIYEGITFA